MTLKSLEEKLDDIDGSYGLQWTDDLLIIIARILLLCAAKYLGEK